jgi:hypothetical protein
MQLLCLVLLLHALVAASATSCRSIRQAGWHRYQKFKETKPNKTCAKKKGQIFILVAEHEVSDKVAMNLIWMFWLIALFPLPGSWQA